MCFSWPFLSPDGLLIRSSAMAVAPIDLRGDPLTAAAIGSSALIAATLTHEALGHGTMCLALGGTAVIYPFSMQCTVDRPEMVAAGPLANLIVGLLLWMGLKSRLPQPPVHAHYFLWLTMAFNLFEFAGYLALGAVTGFGDWAVLLASLHTGWRAGLAVLAALLYYGFMHAVASAGSAFLARDSGLLIWSYAAAGAVASAAGLLTPLGGSYVWVAVAASFGAGFGLIVIRDWDRNEPARPVTRNSGWVIGSAVTVAIFVFIVSRGLKMQR